MSPPARAPEPIAVLGDERPAPARWPYDVDGDRNGDRRARRATTRIAAAFGVTTFALADADAGSRCSSSGCATQDGGRGVAQRHRGRAAGAAARRRRWRSRTRPHGPEWETFYIPVAPGLLRLGANMLAIEVHPSGRRSRADARRRIWSAGAIAASCAGRSSRTSTQTTATIVVETDPNVEAVARVGHRAMRARSHADEPAGRLHRVRAHRARRRARAYALSRARRRVAHVAALAFHTLPGASAVLRIGVYGDVRGGHAMHRRLVERMLGEGLDLVGGHRRHGAARLRRGRLAAVLRGDRASCSRRCRTARRSAITISAGTAPRRSSGAEDVFALPPGPPGRPAGTYWYSRDVADVHLVFLDSNAYERAEQEVWLEADLAAARARGVRAIIAFTHDGPYSRGYHGGNRARARALRADPRAAPRRLRVLRSRSPLPARRGRRHSLRASPAAAAHRSTTSAAACRASRSARSTTACRRSRASTTTPCSAIGKDLELCPRRPDGKLLEKCVRYPLRK